MSTPSGQGQIVVGIDGSPAAAAALTWAAEEARLRGIGLRVVYAFPALANILGTTAHEYFPQIEKEAAATLDQALASVPGLAGLTVERTLVPGNPSEQLVAASRGATLLVVGSHGRGGFVGMLLGSVPTHCVHHAHCPVVVVRAED